VNSTIDAKVKDTFISETILIALGYTYLGENILAKRNSDGIYVYRRIDDDAFEQIRRYRKEC
jgi:hypothetical protein